MVDFAPDFQAGRRRCIKGWFLIGLFFLIIIKLNNILFFIYSLIEVRRLIIFHIRLHFWLFIGFASEFRLLIFMVIFVLRLISLEGVGFPPYIFARLSLIQFILKVIVNRLLAMPKWFLLIIIILIELAILLIGVFLVFFVVVILLWIVIFILIVGVFFVVAVGIILFLILIVIVFLVVLVILLFGMIFTLFLIGIWIKDILPILFILSVLNAVELMVVCLLFQG